MSEASDVLDQHLADSIAQLKPEKPMSVTGIKAGDVKGILQKVRDRQAASLAKVSDLAKKSEAVALAMDGVTGAAHKELDDTLAELGQFSNLGPSLGDHDDR